MENYPALSLILRFGTSGALILAIAVAVLAGLLLAPSLGLVAWPVGVVVGALLFLLAKSFVEIVTILCEMLVPR